MNNIINFIAFQIIWLIAVIGAANNLLWPTIVTVFIFSLWQLSPHRRHSLDPALVAISIAFGALIDGFCQAAGLIEFQLSIPILPPIWILLLWITLALSINHSLAWLKRKSWFSIAFGFFGAPLSYYAGHRLGAVNFPNGVISFSLVISFSWAFVMYFLTHVDNFYQRLQRI